MRCLRYVQGLFQHETTTPPAGFLGPNYPIQPIWELYIALEGVRQRSVPEKRMRLSTAQGCPESWRG